VGLRSTEKRSYPGRDHAQPDPQFERQHGLTPRVEHMELMQRDFLSYLIGKRSRAKLWDKRRAV